MARKSAEQRAAEKVAQDAAIVSNQAALTDPGKVASEGVVKPASAGAKVTVACKIGVGWFDLQLSKLIEKSENTQTGPRKIMEAVRLPGLVRIRGTAYPRGTPPEGFPERPEMVAGYALTRGVDKEFWDAWEKQHSQSPYVMNKMIFAYESEDAVRGLARENVANLSGLEPVAPDKDGRLPRSTSSGVAPLSTDEGRLARQSAQGLS